MTGDRTALRAAERDAAARGLAALADFDCALGDLNEVDQKLVATGSQSANWSVAGAVIVALRQRLERVVS